MKAKIRIVKSKMLGLLAFSFFLTLILSAKGLYAQDPVTHQYWLKLEESPKRIDASYCVMDCNGTGAEIFIQLFNESPDGQTVSFKLKISDGANDPTYYTVTDYALDAAAMVNPECGTTSYSDLRFAVPDGFDPKTLQVEITYP